MKQKIEMVDDDSPRLLTPQREQLSGKYECAHSQIIEAVQMLEDNVIRYPSVDECVKRA